MFSSHLKIKPNSNPSAATDNAPIGNRADESQTIHHDRNLRHANSNHTRGAIGTLAAIALLMWFISFFLLAGPGIGVSDNADVRTSLHSSANVMGDAQ